jgi:hypothetical protein
VNVGRVAIHRGGRQVDLLCRPPAIRRIHIAHLEHVGERPQFCVGGLGGASYVAAGRGPLDPHAFTVRARRVRFPSVEAGAAAGIHTMPGSQDAGHRPQHRAVRGVYQPMAVRGNNEGTVKTNPDPTEAVKEALTLAIKNLSDLTAGKFEANDRAVRLARDELAAQLSAMVLTIDGKFAANKDLVDQLAKANAVALSAALQTQKESAAKSEVSVGDLLKQLQVSFETANRTTNEKIDRLTSRMDTGEGRGFGDTESKHDRSSDKSQTVAVGAALIAFAALIFGIVMALRGH